MGKPPSDMGLVRFPTIQGLGDKHSRRYSNSPLFSFRLTVHSVTTSPSG